MFISGAYVYSFVNWTYSANIQALNLRHTKLNVRFIEIQFVPHREHIVLPLQKSVGEY